MEISILTLKLIILLTPGVLAAKVYNMLTVQHKTQSDFMFAIVSIIFGMFSYLTLQIIYIIFCAINWVLGGLWGIVVLNAFKNISDGNVIPFLEVILASILGLCIAFVATRMSDRKTIFKWARKLNVSNKYGDENLYTYFLNSPDIGYVYVRDIDKSLTYLGWVNIFSETEEFKEIVLGDVTVYNYPDSDELYQVESIYLCFPKDKVIIEQAINTENGKK